MQNSVKIKNIVLIGTFDSSIFDKHYFIKNEILKEEEILSNSSFDSFVGPSIVTAKFNFHINGNQIIIVDLQPDSKDNTISLFMLKFIQKSSLNNYVALGINFHWFMEVDKTLE